MPWSEYQRIRDDLRRMALIFDFTRGHLGEKLLDLVVDGIERAADNESDPDGTPWAALSPDYAKWKARVHPGKGIGHRDELMLSRAELEGVRRIDPASAEMEYGITNAARDEAGFFQDGSGNRPPRPFYGISQDAAAEIGQWLDDRFDDFFS